MSKLEELKSITSKHELSKLLGIKISVLTYVLYILKPETQYTSFTIPKKSGGMRTILAPSDKLKKMQSRLSKLLLDCIDEINKSKTDIDSRFKPTLSHGFVRKRSIATNAMMHLHKKNVLNIDLQDFFDSFNFGRVRGFFIANNHFKLDPHIATVIAQIACYENKLPQGSPCSPVITNLITHSLDIRLASLAKKHSCTYTRYADDITFSTRETIFPKQIMHKDGTDYKSGKKLKSEITRAGFAINEKKTRIQYKNSRQDVTGLVVNKKPNVKKEYWRKVRSQCHSIFRTGAFTKDVDGIAVGGNINMLEGQLNFIDQIDLFNRLRQKPPLNPEYAIERHGVNTNKLLNGREKTFSRFLYYRLFYGNLTPTILCEGETDNVYIKSAINILASSYPTLATPISSVNPPNLLVRFLNYSPRTKFILQLHGGTSYLSYFISAFDKNKKFYKAPNPIYPVIIVLDNDSGFKSVGKELKKIETTTVYPSSHSKHDFSNSEFIHVVHNLYVVLTPLGKKGEDTDIECLFDDTTRLKTYKGRCFNTIDNRNENIDLSKASFANNIVKAHKSSIDFSGFIPLLDRIVKVIEHYDSIK